MSDRQVVIAIDAMGGENSPFKVLKGTEIFLEKEKDTKVVFFGNQELINQTIKKNNIKLYDFEVINT